MPKTQEEIAWFVEYLKKALSEVKTMSELADLWTDNVVSVKSLPEALKQELIRAKDEQKSRFT